MEFSDFVFAERRERCAYGYGGHGLGSRLRRGHAGESVGTKNLCAALNMAGAAGSSQGKINGNNAIGEFMGVPISTHLLYQLIDVRHAQFGFTGCFCWRRFWPRSFSESGRRAPVGYGCALYAALSHARYSALFAICVVTLGAGALEALFDERPDALQK